MRLLRRILGNFAWLSFLALAFAPFVSAQEGGPTAVAERPVGTVFHWLNFVLVFGALGYLIAKTGGPYFRERAQAISAAIGGAAEANAEAERELRDVNARVSELDREVQEMRQAAAKESAAEAERIRALARTETEKIAQAGQAEIEASERAGKQELRAIAARVATERAAALLRERMNKKAEAALFETFVGELERTAR